MASEVASEAASAATGSREEAASSGGTPTPTRDPCATSAATPRSPSAQSKVAEDCPVANMPTTGGESFKNKKGDELWVKTSAGFPQVHDFARTLCTPATT